MLEAVPALRLGEAVEHGAADRPQGLDGPSRCALQEPLELREHEFDRVEIRTVRRQVDDPRASCRDRLTNTRDLMDAEIVHNDDVARPERGYQVVSDPAKEDLAVDGPIYDQGRRQASRAKGSEEGRRLPVTVRHAGQQAFALGRPATRPGHVRLGPCFVDEHEPIWVQERLLPLELLPPLRDVRPLPFRGDKYFFLTVRRSRWSAVQSV